MNYYRKTIDNTANDLKLKMQIIIKGCFSN